MNSNDTERDAVLFNDATYGPLTFQGRAFSLLADAAPKTGRPVIELHSLAKFFALGPLTVSFLAGDESAWVTGEVLHIDGGHSLRRGPDFRAFLEPLFGEAGLRGAVVEG